MNAQLVAVCISENKGERKTPVKQIELRKTHGIVGDAHAGEFNDRYGCGETMNHILETICRRCGRAWPFSGEDQSEKQEPSASCQLNRSEKA